MADKLSGGFVSSSPQGGPQDSVKYSVKLGGNHDVLRSVLAPQVRYIVKRKDGGHPPPHATYSILMAYSILEYQNQISTFSSLLTPYSHNDV